MKIIPATESDYDFARCVHHQAYKEMVLRQYGSWDVEVQDGFFEEAWRRLPHSIIWNDDSPCGYCCIEQEDGVIQLREVAISPDYQNQGIGTTLLRELIERGNHLKLPVKLNVMKTNADARRLYERMGFRVRGETDTHYLMEIPDP